MMPRPAPPTSAMLPGMADPNRTAPPSPSTPSAPGAPTMPATVEHPNTAPPPKTPHQAGQVAGQPVPQQPGAPSRDPATIVGGRERE